MRQAMRQREQRKSKTSGFMLTALKSSLSHEKRCVEVRRGRQRVSTLPPRLQTRPCGRRVKCALSNALMSS